MNPVVKAWIIEGICLVVLLASSAGIYISGRLFFEYYVLGM